MTSPAGVGPLSEAQRAPSARFGTRLVRDPSSLSQRMGNQGVAQRRRIRTHSEQGTPAERPAVSAHTSTADAGYRETSTGAILGLDTHPGAGLFMVLSRLLGHLRGKPEPEQMPRNQLEGLLSWMEHLATGLESCLALHCAALLTLVGGEIGAVIGALRATARLVETGQRPDE